LAYLAAQAIGAPAGIWLDAVLFEKIAA